MKIRLQAKIISFVLFPAITIGIMAGWISSNKITQIMEQEMHSQLKTLAYAGCQFYESINNEPFSQDESGTVKKGDFIITDNYLFVDGMMDHADVYASFFYQDERIVTNVLDYKGARMIRTSANQIVADTVLKKGLDYFSSNVIIGGEEYYGYYVPVHQPKTNEVVGMFFTGDNVSKVREAANTTKKTIFFIIIGVVTASIILTSFLVLNMTGALKKTVKDLEDLSNGVLSPVHYEKKIRTDEIGDIVKATYKLKHTLNDLIRSISTTSSILFDSARDMELIFADNTQSTLEIYESLEKLSAASIQQAVSLERITGLIQDINSSDSSVTPFINDVIDFLLELSALAEENAASTQTTSDATDRLTNSMIDIEKEIKVLRELAANLNQQLKGIHFYE